MAEERERKHLRKEPKKIFFVAFFNSVKSKLKKFRENLNAIKYFDDDNILVTDEENSAINSENINLQTSNNTKKEVPSISQLEKELDRVKHRINYSNAIRNTVFTLVTVAAAAILVATLLLPVLQIYGSSMTPTISEGNIVVSVKGSDFERGDIISFYYNNKILVKRVVAFEGEWVDIDSDGNVFINDTPLNEPYIKEKALGECDIKFPYQVPDGKIFVCGDHRATSVDSRSSKVGCVSEEQLVGKIVFRVWPLKRFGKIS